MTYPLDKKFSNTKVILGSQSPRRRELLKHILSDFTSISLDVNEVYSVNLKGKEITEYLCALKADAYSIQPNEILITADTIVWFDNKALEKPKDAKEAKDMLSQLSSKEHKVISSFCIKSIDKTIIESNTTRVTFNELKEEEIDFYVDNFSPLDKAGSYGIQEWVGCIGVQSIHGSFYNVMGLALHKIYASLVKF